MEAQEIKHPILDRKWFVVKDEVGGISIANTDKTPEEINQVDEIIFINCRFRYVAERIVELHNKDIDKNEKASIAIKKIKELEDKK